MGSGIRFREGGPAGRRAWKSWKGVFLILPGPARIFIFILVFTCSGSHAQQGPDATGVDGVFESESLLEFNMIFDFESLMNDLGDDPSYHPARVKYGKDSSDMQELSIEVRARGNFRKNPENCDFPPLKVKIERRESTGSEFEKVKEVKVVTHCQTGIEEFDQYVFQEYLIYKAYNLLTDFSFRVRLAYITYVDSKGQVEPFSRYAFLIEDPDAMAERNGSTLLDLAKVPADKLDRKAYSLMSVFNYLIFNTDYAVPILHNIELVSTNYFEPPIPVPYDFDWSGIINIPYDSPYAATRSKYPERTYKGPCLKMKELNEVFTIMTQRKDELFDLYRDFPYLTEEFRKRSLQELELFYINISNKSIVRKDFIRKCED